MNRPEPRAEFFSDWCLDRIATALERIADAKAPPLPPQGTPLPDDFPARDELEAAGIVHLENVPKKASGLAALGLDGTAINRVLTWLKVNK